MPKRKNRIPARKRGAVAKLTPDRQRHMRSILKQFKREFTEKYAAGQKEHGGNLEDRNCADEAAKEAIDLVAYIHCERVKRARAVAILSKWDGKNHTAYDILVTVRDLYVTA